MVGLGERPGVCAIWLAAALGVASWRALPTPATPSLVATVEEQPVVATGDPRPFDRSLSYRADRAYRAGRFDEAAAIIAEAVVADDSLRSLGELYAQAARAWRLESDPLTPAGDAFWALREAWKLDTVLSAGAFTEVLFERTRQVSAEAAHAYLAAKDWARAQQVLDTAGALGVDTQRLDAELARSR